MIQISFELRILLGIAAMALLFTTFIISFVTSQRKKLEYQQNMQEILAQQNIKLENMVEERTAELNRQKEALQYSLVNLKNTQAQLVQIEKMASLGEMTAGIAHEIRNPLNFITNFSEVSNELFTEMEEALHTKNLGEVENISHVIQKNLEKIKHHSDRADKIVKNMLEHSRKGVSQKLFANINDLANNSLQLSYQNMVLKPEKQPVKLEVITDDLVPPLLIAGQEMSRVIVNLCNNAFYSVLQKFEKNLEANFEPAVRVETKLSGRSVLITISDNGMGISENISEKIFQPFFTTKPAGIGTGLGLSLSHDIITKMHGGTLDVESKEGNGASFRILLPLE